jgi:hypothetical protein
VAFLVIQTTTPYNLLNLLWVHYGKHFFKSQVFFHSTDWIYGVKQVSDPGREGEKEKIVVGWMTRTINPRFPSNMLPRRDEKISSKKLGKG